MSVLKCVGNTINTPAIWTLDILIIYYIYADPQIYTPLPGGNLGYDYYEMYKPNPEPIRVLNDYNFNEFVSMGQNVLVEFYAPWVPFMFLSCWSTSWEPI